MTRARAMIGLILTLEPLHGGACYPPYRVVPPFEASLRELPVTMVKDPRHRPAAFVPIRRGQDRWWWVLTAGLLAGLLLYLFRHL